MIKKLLPLLVTAALLLAACAPAAAPGTPGEEAALSIVTTTYPLYLFASEVTRGVPGVSVSLLVQQDLSCLHDYTLTVKDMKLLEQADVLILNGGGLDDFVAETLAATPGQEGAILVNCAQNLSLLGSQGAPEHDHDHDQDGQEEHQHGALDPHYWLDPALAAAAVETMAAALSRLQPEAEAIYRENAEAAVLSLRSALEAMRARLGPLTTRELVTFHDGFQYFARAFDLVILCSIQEEESREASAKVVAEMAALVRDHNLPALFTEVYSSDATAQAIARETGAAVYPLSMIMSGPVEDPGLALYLEAMEQNVTTVLEALQ